MLDWIAISRAGFTLKDPAAATILGIVAFLALFATALAERAFRRQSLGIFIGVASAMLLAVIFTLATIGQALLGVAWVQKLSGGELFFHVFSIGLSGLWLGAVISPLRLREMTPAQSRRLFLSWLIALGGTLAIALICGAGEGYGFFYLTFNEAIRQILVGIAAGIFVIAAGVSSYRWWRERAALWIWLMLASLAFCTSLSLFYFAADLPLLAYATFGLAIFLVITGLFADHVRFFDLESQLRLGLLDNALKLEEENQRQIAILAFMREAVLQLDRDERIIYLNAQFEQLISSLGQTRVSVKFNDKKTEITGQKLSHFLSREFYQKLIPSLQEARLGRTSLMEIQHANAAGEEKYLQIYATPLHDKNEKIYRFHLGLLDVSSRHVSAQSLAKEIAEKNKELRILQQSIENATDGVVITDADLKILYANETFERITGIARSEILGRTPQAYRLDGEGGRYAEISKRLHQQKSWRGEAVGRRKDGSQFISNLAVIPVKDAEEKIIRYVWIERDITDRKNLEAQLRRQEEALAQKDAELLQARQHAASLQGRTGEQQHRIEQLAKLMEIGEDIRLNVGLEKIMQTVGEAVAALGWQRVLIFQRDDNDTFALVVSSGFANRALALRPMRQMSYSDFAPYLLERFRLSRSFFIDSSQLPEVKRLAFMPSNSDSPLTAKPKDGDMRNGEWLMNDALLVPIRGRDQIVGLIAVANPADGRRPDQQRVRDLEMFADDAAIAMENNRLLQLHQSNERQARVLADIGKAFRASGTVEQVVAEIAGIGAQALECPCLVCVQPFGDGRWLSALGSFTAKSGRPKNRLLETAELPETFINRMAAVSNSADTGPIELSLIDLSGPVGTIIDEAAKNKFATEHGVKAQVVALRSRGRNIGLMAYLLPADISVHEYTKDIGFVTDLADRAALIIENARLFHETDDKALALERANQHISEFLASVSHELRTPMHSILQFSEILMSEAPGGLNQEQKRQVAVVQRSGKNLLALLNDILDLSKIEAGKMEAIIEEFDPTQLVREATDFIRPLCAEKHLELRLRIDPNFPKQFRSDRSMLSRALTNLLGNAVKFTEHGEIEVSASRLSFNKEKTVKSRQSLTTLIISVRDTGSGIPKAKQKEIFEPFRQLDTSERRRHGGTGLGLAISKKMLAILDGEIEVESEVSKGSKFTIQIPESTALARPASREEKFRVREPKSKADDGKKTATKTALRFVLPNRKGPHVLVVEDDESTRYAMQFILENAGYQVEFAEGGEKALQAAQHQRPDLILMDIMMPNMDGYQVVRLLKTQKQLAQIPVIALTARAMKGDREKALAAGCSDYLTKPFESKDILAMLEKWLA